MSEDVPTQRTSDDQPGPPASDRTRNILSLVAGVIVGGIIFMGFSYALFFAYVVGDQAARNATPVPPTPLPGWAIPDGFAMSPTDSEVAYRLDAGGPCAKYSCWHMTAITANGCPHYLSIYVEALGANGRTVMTHMEDKVESVRPGEEAKLVFENVLASVKDVRIYRVACY